MLSRFSHLPLKLESVQTYTWVTARGVGWVTSLWNFPGAVELAAALSRASSTLCASATEATGLAEPMAAMAPRMIAAILAYILRYVE